MTREQVFVLIQAHLADELDVEPERIEDSTRFKEDLEADSLDLYTLVQELEDTYGVRDLRRAGGRYPHRRSGCGFRRGTLRSMSELATVTENGSVQLLRSLLDELPDELARQVFTHASWTERRSDSYTRLAFLGDSVLSLAITTHLYPRLEAERFGAGRLTKIRAQAVSGRSCRAVAERLDVGERLRAAAPESGEGRQVGMLETERVLASVIEAVIGACYLNSGYETTAEAVVEAFSPEIEHALEHPLDFKSALAGAACPARRDDRLRGDRRARPAARSHLRGGGDARRQADRQRQRAQQEARRAAGRPQGAGEPRQSLMHLKSLILKGFKSFPDRTSLDFGPGVSVVVGPNGSGKSNVTDALLWAMGEQSPLAVRGSVDAGCDLRRRPRRAGAQLGRGRDRAR